MLYCDTETTGVGETAEILSIAIINDHGTILLDTYLTPTHTRSWEKAMETNHITPEFIFGGNFPTAAEIEDQIREIFGQNIIVFYGKHFDGPIIARSWPQVEFMEHAEGGMERFARFRGFPPTKSYHKKYRTWKLIEAAELTQFNWSNAKHSAIGDAQATRHVWHWLDTYAPEPELAR